MSTQTKNLITLAGACVFIFVGVYFRVFAKELAWPRTYSFSGPRSETEWARKEVAYQQAGLVLILFGGMAGTAVLTSWLVRTRDDPRKDNAVQATSPDSFP